MGNLSSLTGDRTQEPLHWEHRVLTTGTPGKSKNVLKDMHLDVTSFFKPHEPASASFNFLFFSLFTSLSLHRIKENYDSWRWKWKWLTKPKHPSIKMKPFVSVQDSRQVGYVGKAGWNHAALLRLGVVASPGSLRGEPGCGQQGWCCRSTGQQGLSRLCAYSLPPTESSRQHTCVEKRARGPRSELSFHLRQCCGWFDLLSRTLKLSSDQ